jgi:hypothetical protein
VVGGVLGQRRDDLRAPGRQRAGQDGAPQLLLGQLRQTLGERLTVTRFEDPAPYRRIGIAYRPTSPRAEDFALLAEEVRTAVRARRWRVRLRDVIGKGGADRPASPVGTG